MKVRSIYMRDGRAPVPKREITSKIMSSIRAKNTEPEIRLRKAFFKEHIRGYRIHCKKIPGRPDICFAKKKVAIFVHGCFWHQCPYCRPSLPKTHKQFWKDKFASNIERDKLKILELRKMKWKVLVFWECKIRKNIGEYVKTTKEVLSGDQ